jgi:hypothetical protein
MPGRYPLNRMKKAVLSAGGNRQETGFCQAEIMLLNSAPK